MAYEAHPHPFVDETCQPYHLHMYPDKDCADFLASLLALPHALSSSAQISPGQAALKIIHIQLPLHVMETTTLCANASLRES